MHWIENIEVIEISEQKKQLLSIVQRAPFACGSPLLVAPRFQRVMDYVIHSLTIQVAQVNNDGIGGPFSNKSLGTECIFSELRPSQARGLARWARLFGAWLPAA
jgi:hypothetical protein